MKTLPIAFSFLLLLTACPSKKPQEAPKPDLGSLQQLQLPDWVMDPTVEGMISAVGIAPKTAGGIKMQIAQAEADAMANMASQIQTKVSRITKESMRRAGVATEVKNEEAVDSYFAQATKSIVKDVPISGAKRKKIFQSPIDGSLYIQMVLEPVGVKDYLVSMSDELAGGMKNFSATQKTIEKTEQSMKDLFNEIDFSAKEEDKQ